MQVDKFYKVGIVCKDPISRVGLNILVSNFNNFNVEFTVDFVNKAIQLLWKCELFIYAFQSYNQEVLTSIKRIQNKNQNVPVLAYCPDLANENQMPLMQSGVKGIISYDIDELKLHKVLKCLAYGGTHYPAALQHEIQNGLYRPISPTLIKTAFTSFKIKILTLLAEGLTAKQIGQKLCRTRDTIEWHKRDMRQMIKVKTTAKLLLFAKEYELITPKFTKEARPAAKSINFPIVASPLKIS